MKKNKKKRQKNKENKVIPFKRDLKLVENQNPENLNLLIIIHHLPILDDLIIQARVACIYIYIYI